MYRTIFTPSEQNNNIPFVIPNEWYGQKVEVLVFPVFGTEEQAKQELSVQERRKKREELLNRYPLDLSNFKFNRDEANDYDYSEDMQHDLVIDEKLKIINPFI